MAPRLVRAKRNGPVLHPTVLSQADVPGLNLTRGCGHSCVFCSVRASPNYPHGQTILFTNTAELLEGELAVARPRAVYLCPAADPFPPEEDVQGMTAEVVGVLAAHGVEAWLMTRGVPTPEVLDSLVAHAPWVRVTVALPVLSPVTSALLEAGAATPQSRLQLLEELQGHGIEARVAIDPLVPGLTDTPEALNPLLDALASRGVRSVTASYLFLRRGIAEHLQASLPAGTATAILDAFTGGPVLSPPGLAPARFLPRARRQRGYAALISLAARRGMAVTVSSPANPDFTPDRSGLRGPGLRELSAARVVAGLS